MSNLPPVIDWMDEFPLIDATTDNPVRSGAAGTGDTFVVKLVQKGTAGALNQFMARDGTWVNFASTELNAWGSLIGDITNQTDLWNELQARPLITDISVVGFSGQYNDLLSKPVLGDLAFINTNGLTSQFLRGDGTWAIPVDVNAVWGNINGNINAQTDLITRLNLKADILNPVFTGNPQAPTPVVDNNTTSVATTAFFFGQGFDGLPIMDGVASSGDSTRWARGNHRHPTDTSLAPLDTPHFTGLPTAPTVVFPNSSQLLATTAYVTAALAGAGGIPEAPNDGKTYARKGAAWVEIGVGTKWDQTI